MSQELSRLYGQTPTPPGPPIDYYVIYEWPLINCTYLVWELWYILSLLKRNNNFLFCLLPNYHSTRWYKWCPLLCDQISGTIFKKYLNKLIFYMVFFIWQICDQHIACFLLLVCACSNPTQQHTNPKTDQKQDHVICLVWGLAQGLKGS